MSYNKNSADKIEKELVKAINECFMGNNHKLVGDTIKINGKTYTCEEVAWGVAKYVGTDGSVHYRKAE